MAGYHKTHHTQGSRIIYVNSEDADKHHTEHTTHFTISFKDALHTRKDEAMLVSLHSASVPYSFYNIRTGVNNAVTINIHMSGSFNSLYGLDLTAGNYNVNSLRSAVNTFVQNSIDNYQSQNTAQNVGTHTFEMTYDPPTQKFHFTLTESAGNTPISVVLDFSVAASPAIEMGFTPRQVEVTVTHPQKSEHVADINGSVHALYLRTDIPTRSVFDSSGGVSDVLGKISLSTNPGGIIALQPSESTHSTLVVVNHIKTISIRLTDERNRLLDLNGLHFQFGILFQFVEMYDPWIRSPPQLVEPPAKPKPSTQQRKRAKRRRALRKGKAKVRKAQEMASKTQGNPAPPQTKTA